MGSRTTGTEGPKILQRHFKDQMKWDSFRTYRLKALEKIPFSSIFFCSNPLAAALTRKRTQFFCFALAMVGNLSESWMGQVVEDLTIQKSLGLRFNVIARRSSGVASSHCGFAPSVGALGLTHKGKMISVQNTSVNFESYMQVSFDLPVKWNAWFFVTSNNSPECDPVKFSLETFDGSHWKIIGSSMSMQVTKETVFLHGHFATSDARGFRHDFNVLAPSFFGYFVVRFLGDFQAFSIALCGWLGWERLGAQLPNVQVVLFVFSMLIASTYTRPSQGDYSVLPHLYFATMQGGALYFQLRHEWVNATLWISSFLLAMGVALRPHAPEPALFILSIGAPWFAVAVAIRVFAVWTTRAARRAIADDRRFYDALWALVLDDPASRAAADSLEALLAAAAARRRLPSPPPIAWEVSFSRARQAIPAGPESTGLGARLLGRPATGVLRDLEALFAQAEAAFAPFQRKVFALAAASGAFLPVALGSVIGRGEGMDLAAAATAATGVVRVGSSGSDYIRVGPESEMDEFRWAGLKGVERALEKVRGGRARAHTHTHAGTRTRAHAHTTRAHAHTHGVRHWAH
jgi:hypothetical protein